MRAYTEVAMRQHSHLLATTQPWHAIWLVILVLLALYDDDIFPQPRREYIDATAIRCYTYARLLFSISPILPRAMALFDV